MKAIIVAAGSGTRLRELTRQAPKCLLEVGDRTVLQHQLDALNHNGIRDISVVRGHQADCIQIPGLKYYLNDNYRETNMLSSLMCAAVEMDNDFLATYSDIVFEPNVVSRLCACQDDISVVIDTDWRTRYVGRDEHPVSEAEKVAFDDEHNVVEIGKHLPCPDDAQGEFIGMMKCTARGAEVFRSFYDRAKRVFAGQPFEKADAFEKAYLTDFIQYLVAQSITVRCVAIQGGWLEIDTPQDLQAARSQYA